MAVVVALFNEMLVLVHSCPANLCRSEHSFARIYYAAFGSRSGRRSRQNTLEQGMSALPFHVPMCAGGQWRSTPVRCTRTPHVKMSDVADHGLPVRRWRVVRAAPDSERAGGRGRREGEGGKENRGESVCEGERREGEEGAGRRGARGRLVRGKAQRCSRRERRRRR